MNDIKICVYSICKNESATIIDFLQAALLEADYVSIVDIGSTDDTVQKVRSLNYSDDHIVVINEYSQKKDDYINFAKAKNAAKCASPIDTDVLVYLDINEKIEPGWGNIVRESFATNPGIQSISANITNTFDGDISWSVVRIHKNTPYWIWKGIGDDYLDSIYPYAGLSEFNGKIKFIQNGQYPYNEEQLNSLIKAVELHPYNPYYLTHLGDKYLSQNRVDEALKTWENAIEVCNFTEYPGMYYDLCLNIASVCKDSDPKKALSYLIRSNNIDDTMDSLRRYDIYADIYDTLGQTDKAIEELESGIFSNGSFSSDERNTYYSNGYFEDRLALLYYYRKHDILGAIEHGAKALQLNPNNDGLISNLVLYFKDFIVANGGEVNEK